jgi:acyl dehydratase
MGKPALIHEPDDRCQQTKYNGTMRSYGEKRHYGWSMRNVNEPMRYYEDLSVGDTFTTGTVTVTEDDIRSFAAQFDPQPFHLDRELAQQSLFGELVGSGWHTAALTMRLLVEGDFQLAGGIIGRSAELLEWPQPVRPGDTLRVVSEIMALRPSERRPDRAQAKVRHTTYNQHGAPVQVFVVNQILLRRGAGQP